MKTRVSVFIPPSLHSPSLPPPPTHLEEDVAAQLLPHAPAHVDEGLGAGLAHAVDVVLGQADVRGEEALRRVLMEE